MEGLTHARWQQLAARLGPRRWLVAAAAAVLLLAAGTALRGVVANPDATGPTVVVRRGPFEVYVQATAQLDARQSVTLSSDLPSNAAKIISLAPEGSAVSAGDLVVAFDPAPFELEVRKLENDLNDARLALGQAEAELQLLLQAGNQAKADAAEGVSALELNLRSLQEGDRPLRLAKARNDVVSARATAARAKEELSAQQEMFEAGFGSRAMVEEAQAANAEAENALALAEQSLEILGRVSLPGEIESARLELASKRRQRDASEQALLQQMAKQNALLLRARSAVAEIERLVAVAQEQLQKTRLVAPVSGFVVYKKVPVGGETRKVQVGDSVWNKQGFIVIPDMGSLIATVTVPEQEIGRVAPGQRVRLLPDAYPGLELAGAVTSVGMLATDEAPAAAGPGTGFEVRIGVDGVDARLRPGMRARATILTGSHGDVVHVPVEAVFYEQGKPVCFVWSWGAARRRDVQLGDTDGSYVVIRDGVEAGDRLLLTYPLDAGSRG